MNNTIELVFIPTPGMGHILSTVELAKLILQRNQYISISFYIIKNSTDSPKIKAYVDSQSRNNPYPTRLTFVTFPPLSNPPELSPHAFDKIVEIHKPIVKKTIEDRVRAGLPKPAGFVLDLFCTDMVDVANELNVPSYVFFTSGVTLLNLKFYSLSLVDDHGVDIATEFSDPGFSALVPGFKNPVTSKVIPSMLQEEVCCEKLMNVTRKFRETKGILVNTYMEQVCCEKLMNVTRKFRETKGILVNTYMELEAFAIHALRNSTEDTKIPPVYPVGPILELDNKSRGGSGSGSVTESVMEWLDGQPKSSVVFLCFGSMGISFAEEQIKEIANGLESSGYRFLWALRKPLPDGKRGAPRNDEAFLEALPEGFVDRTANRGKIIGWAPQVAILAHPATCGFVSHCGWNSTLESLWFGVPMATWPMYAEQQLNAFEVVKELELAVEIRMDYKTGFKRNFLVTAEEVENGAKNLMGMDEKMREKIKKMSDEGKRALEEGGSSYNWLGRFIEDVLSNVS